MSRDIANHSGPGSVRSEIAKIILYMHKFHRKIEIFRKSQKHSTFYATDYLVAVRLSIPFDQIEWWHLFEEKKNIRILIVAVGQLDPKTKQT